MKKAISIKCPLVPNFLLDINNNPISIKDFTEDELEEIGQEWIEELIKKSKS